MTRERVYDSEPGLDAGELWTAVITVFLTFVLTGLIANRLIQAWQQRNWLSQRRLADTESQYEALSGLFDEVAILASKRHHRALRLLFSIHTMDAETTRTRLTEYDSAVVEWNERLNAVYAKLTMYLRYRFTHRLENEIHL